MKKIKESKRIRERERHGTFAQETWYVRREGHDTLMGEMWYVRERGTWFVCKRM